MGAGITWADALAGGEEAAQVALAVFRALGWNVLWQEADGNEATPVLAAEPYGETLLAVTLDPDFAARRGYVIMPVDAMPSKAVTEIERGGDYVWDGRRFPASVHGGISFSSAVADENIDGIGTDGSTFAIIGFDCIHIGDGTDTKTARELELPYTQAHPGEGTRQLPPSLALVGHVWTDEEVLAECRHLADQLLDQRAA